MHFRICCDGRRAAAVVVVGLIWANITETILLLNRHLSLHNHQRRLKLLLNVLEEERGRRKKDQNCLLARALTLSLSRTIEIDFSLNEI